MLRAIGRESGYLQRCMHSLPSLPFGLLQHQSFFSLPGFDENETRKRYEEKKLFGFSPSKVYDVVAAVESYSEFVPWCVRSSIIRQQPNYLEAELEVGFQIFTERYTSKVTLQPKVRVLSRVEDSTLFDHLSNRWEFKPGPTPDSTWLIFEVDFAFRSPLYRQIASVFFEEVVQKMVSAFEQRCGRLYGQSSLITMK